MFERDHSPHSQGHLLSSELYNPVSVRTQEEKVDTELEGLKSLTRPKVTITLDFREDMHDHGLIPASNCQTRWRPNDQGMHAKDGSHPHGCPDRPFAANAEDLIDDPIVTAILKDLAPLVSLLSARGHIISVIDKNTCAKCVERVKKMRGNTLR